MACWLFSCPQLDRGWWTSTELTCGRRGARLGGTRGATAAGACAVAVSGDLRMTAPWPQTNTPASIHLSLSSFRETSILLAS